MPFGCFCCYKWHPGKNMCEALLRRHPQIRKLTVPGRFPVRKFRNFRMLPRKVHHLRVRTFGYSNGGRLQVYAFESGIPSRFLFEFFEFSIVSISFFEIFEWVSPGCFSFRQGMPNWFPNLSGDGFRGWGTGLLIPSPRHLWWSFSGQKRAQNDQC